MCKACLSWGPICPSVHVASVCVVRSGGLYLFTDQQRPNTWLTKMQDVCIELYYGEFMQHGSLWL